ncbi:NAD-dependent epimerase/dehydratase family protein [Acuticoccus yangtzensis]|uniref:NAD-dependent epimerase/dehydratase family protein n=1 Tax=Acuticoccus yangtzensis TaxID=1443441 RepID=UPI000AD5B46B|nr:NAD-dependent epimerase/dehydratase family protein [Acuticoccus yangtzensis]
MSRIARKGDLGVVEWFRPGEQDRVPVVLDKMAAIGATRLRTGVSWADWFRPEGPDWFDWLIPELARHVELLPCFHYTPPSLGIVDRSNAPPREPKAYADFLDVFVTRHGSCFDWVELWNEPNNLLDWDWRLDPEWTIFAEMIGGAAYWMHQRGKKVLLGGNCPTDLNWLRHMTGLGLLEHVDALGVHAFPGTWSIDWTGWADELAGIRKTLNEAGCERPLWITEAGFSTWRHDEAGQARELLAAVDAQADRLYWYALEDLAADVPTQQGFHVDERHYHMGLFRADHSPKLAARALAAGGVERLAQTVALARPQVRTATPRVVVTGGAGFLGSNLVDQLAADGQDVVVLDSLARDRVEENAHWLTSRHRHRIAFEVGDVRDPFVAADAIKGASAVIHLAAQVAVTTSVADPVHDFEANARGTLNVLEAVRHGAPDAPVLFASTNKVYGELIPRDEMVREGDRYVPRDPARRGGLDETTPLSFHSPYGCSKGVADQYVLDYARVYGLKSVVMRMSCLYGPRQFGTEDQGWVAHFLICALTGRPITIFGDGYQARDVLYVDDAVSAYRAAMKEIDSTAGRAFNLGGGPRNVFSLRELIALIPDIAGVAPEVGYAPWRPSDQAWYVSDTRAISAATGWQPHISAPDGLNRLADWLRTAVPDALAAAPKEKLA